jgi:hypothetical protein
VDDVEGISLDGAANKEGIVYIAEVVGHFLHADGSWAIQDETEATAAIVRNQKHDRAGEVRVSQ